MYFQGFQESGLHMIRQTELTSHRFYNGGNFPVMHMAYVCKQVVLYLEIQPAYKPGQESVAGGKVCCIGQFMNSPAVFHMMYPVHCNR